MTEFREFSDDQQTAARAARLESELQWHRQGVEREIVLLQAESKEALMKTHRRYFSDLKELLEGFEETVKGL